MKTIDNNSFKFVNKRMLEQGRKAIKEDDTAILRLSELFNITSNEKLLGKNSFKFNGRTINIVMVCADEEFNNFDFYSTHEEHNDGTLAFVQSAITEILDRLLTLQSVPKNKLSKEEDVADVSTIKIVVGDAVVVQFLDESPDKKRPWMTNKLEVYIPSYFELLK